MRQSPSYAIPYLPDTREPEFKLGCDVFECGSSRVAARAGLTEPCTLGK